MTATAAEEGRVRDILAAVRPLAAEFYRLTGKPLGVTGEVAEFVAAETLGLRLAPARQRGYDAVRVQPEGDQRIQIKGRVVGARPAAAQRMSRIKLEADCDAVLRVILDRDFEPIAMWEATYADVVARLSVPGSKARERGSLSTADFRKVARKVWPEGSSVKKAVPGRRPRRAGTSMNVDAEARRKWAEGTKHGAFNGWLDGQVRGPSGDLDLESMYSVALSFGVTERYDHLNPGQQRMNLGNRLRRVVPRAA